MKSSHDVTERKVETAHPGVGTGVKEIAPREWPSFFREVSLRRCGLPVSLLFFEPTLRTEVREPAADFEGGVAGVRGISILLRDRSGPHLYRDIEGVRVWHQADNDGREQIEIEAPDGSRTTLEFVPPRSERLPVV
jgi:hypothetical protein